MFLIVKKTLLPLIKFVFLVAFLGCSSNDKEASVEAMNQAAGQYLIQFEPLIRVHPDEQLCPPWLGVAVIPPGSGSRDVSELFFEIWSYDGNSRIIYSRVNRQGDFIESYIIGGDSYPFLLGNWTSIPDVRFENDLWIVSGFIREVSNVDELKQISITGNILEGGHWNAEFDYKEECEGTWAIEPYPEGYARPAEEGTYQLQFTDSYEQLGLDERCHEVTGTATVVHQGNSGATITLNLEILQGDVETLEPIPADIFAFYGSTNRITSADEFAELPWNFRGEIDKGGEWGQANGCYGEWSATKIEQVNSQTQ